jgi:hypothetical protein
MMDKNSKPALSSNSKLFEIAISPCVFQRRLGNPEGLQAVSGGCCAPANRQKSDFV